MADVRLSFEERKQIMTDLTPLDFFLSGTVNDEAYKRKARHLDTLRNEIQAVVRRNLVIQSNAVVCTSNAAEEIEIANSTEENHVYDSVIYTGYQT
ncbi:hypothetical protein BgiBS90_037879, partial [Biomphalaria glabrata]